MCAVIGAFVNKPQEKDFQIVEKLFIESKIRGLHATGLSYVKNEKITTIKYAIPADEFIKRFDVRKLLNEDGNLYLIGHCRYSTSDLEYNQPIADTELSVVHNGVITQEPFEKWEKHFGLKCEGKNDTELLFQTFKTQRSALPEPFLKWPESSFSYICLQNTEFNKKSITFGRNGKRPLYFAYQRSDIPGYYGNRLNWYIFSTKDIGARAKLENIQKALPNKIYSFHGYNDNYVPLAPESNYGKIPEITYYKDLQC